MRPDLLYHYTPATRLPEIIASGIIRLATAGVPRSEKAAAWFSSNPDWDHSATKGVINGVLSPELYFPPNIIPVLPQEPFIRLTLEEQRERFGLGRIVVPGSAAPVSWAKFKRTSGIQPWVAKSLERQSRKEGSDPSEWWASYAPVPSSRWLGVEIHDGHRWRPFEDADTDPEQSPFACFREPQERVLPPLVFMVGSHGETR